MPDGSPDLLSTGDQWMSVPVTDLRQRQRYAFYVHAKVTLANESNDAYNVEQGVSEMRYFETGTRIPLPPFVYTGSKTNDSITISWFHPAWDTNRYVEEYLIDVYQ